MRNILLCIALTSILIADEQKQVITPELIAAQLQDAQNEFDQARKMFTPWYAGPLLTPGAHMLHPGRYVAGTNLNFTCSYAEFDKHGHSKNTPNLYSLDWTLAFAFGMLKWVYGAGSIQTVSNWKKGKHANGLGDSYFSLNFGLQNETAYKPAMLISVTQSFPTGKYSQLSPSQDKVDAMGLGAYSTSVNFNISKIVWWMLNHPINFRGSLGFTFPSKADVVGYHAYGGGRETKGTIHTPKALYVDFAAEYSFTQNWIIACDAVYTYNWKTTFSGQPGFNEEGSFAKNSLPLSTSLSFAPAIEFVPNEKIALTSGVWITAWGRSASKFVSYVVNFTYTF